MVAAAYGLLMALTGLAIPAALVVSAVAVDPVRAPWRRRFVSLAPDLASASGRVRVRGRVRALRTVPCPFSAEQIVAYVLSIRRSKGCACIADCPHEGRQPIFERGIGELVLEDASAVVRFEGPVELASEGARTVLVSGDLVEVLGVMREDEHGGIDDAPDRSRRAARVITAEGAAPLVLVKVASAH